MGSRGPAREALSPAQERALAHVRARAEAASAEAERRVGAVLARAALPGSALDALRDGGPHARVTLSFHPDRVRADGTTVAEGLLAEGRYRSQFETGITAGSPTAFPGGDRDRWEEALFGGAYQAAGVRQRQGASPPDTPREGARTGDKGVPGARPAERPKYGALDLMAHPDGGSPRFGSSYLVLRRHIVDRCTFTWGDSHVGPEHVGTADVMAPLLAVLLESVEATGEALGVAGLDVARLLARLSSGPGPGAPVARALDTYVEAQVHGDVDLSTDVAAIVADPSFQGTPSGERLGEIAARYGAALGWHPGFVLLAGEVPADFRGPLMVPLALHVAAAHATTPGEVDAAAIGRAAAHLQRAPEAFHGFGTPEEAWQLLKQLWHVLVRFGRAPGTPLSPVRASSRRASGGEAP